MTDGERERFDGLLEEALGALPEGIAALLEESPVIVDDRPDAELVRSLCREWGEEHDPALADELCGLHSGVPLTERSVESVDVPEQIRLFRVGIVNTAGGWDGPEADEAVYEEIVVTLLHEIGHHFGLDEDDLESLGYG